MMKSNISVRLLLTAFFLVLLLLQLATPFAQAADASSRMMDTALLKLFGGNTNFTCKADIHVFDAVQKETDVVPLGFTVSDSKLRMDIDFTQVKGSDIPPA